MIIEQIPLWVAATNAWVVAKGPGEPAMVVDAPPQPEEVGAFLAEAGLSVSAIVLTHGHIDHTGGAGVLAGSTTAAVYVHRDDDFLTLHPEEQLRGLFGMIPPGDFSLPERFEGMENGDKIEIGGVGLEVRHTPGHTPGHCCLLWAEEGVLFSGDQLFAGSIGRTDLPGGSYEDLVTSMRDQVMTLDDDVRVLPGHGPETTIGQERRTNPFRFDWV